MAISTVVIIVFNSLRKNDFEQVTLKGLKFFLSSLINAILILAHYPAALLNYFVFWPIIHNCVSIRSKKNKEWFASNLFIIFWTLLSISVLFGTFIFHHTSQKQLNLNKRSLTEQVVVNLFEAKNTVLPTILSDYFYAGSNIWVYFCTILVPNFMYIIQV